MCGYQLHLNILGQAESPTVACQHEEFFLAQRRKVASRIAGVDVRKSALQFEGGRLAKLSHGIGAPFADIFDMSG
jgi:hypothetical protein